MLCKRTADTVNALYMNAKKKKTSATISCEYPATTSMFNERYRMTHTELGIIHACNVYCAPLQQFCTRYRNYRDTIATEQKCPIGETLGNALRMVKFKEDYTYKDVYKTKTTEIYSFYDHVVFIEISTFLVDLKQWLLSKNIYLEPFQKNSLMHIVFFLAATRTPQYSYRLFEYLKFAFNLEYTSDTIYDIFKQKITVFIVPRRHGKTWILIPVITFLLKNFNGLSIGYVAHQKHVSQHVMKEVCLVDI